MRSDAGTEAAKTRSSTTAAIRESPTSWVAAGAWSADVRLGSSRTPTDTSISVMSSRADGAENVCVPWRKPPTTKASPRTSRMLARIEPMTAEVATWSSPARRAKSAMKSSGRLPSALCSTPVAPGFIRSES